MDPNECRKAIIWHAAQLRKGKRAGLSEDMRDAAADLASAVDDLITWQRGNGFPPADGYPWAGEHMTNVAELAGLILAAERDGKDGRMRGRGNALAALIHRN